MCYILVSHIICILTFIMCYENATVFKGIAFLPFKSKLKENETENKCIFFCSRGFGTCRQRVLFLFFLIQLRALAQVAA